MAYENVLTFKWNVPRGGITISIWVRGRLYRRAVGPRGELSLHETAGVLNKDFTTVLRWARSGKIKSAGNRGGMRIPLSEVKKLRKLGVDRGRNLDLA